MRHIEGLVFENGKYHIEVLRHVPRDYSLPKFKKEDKESSSGGFISNSTFAVFDGDDSTEPLRGQARRNGWLSRLSRFVADKFRRNPQEVMVDAHVSMLSMYAGLSDIAKEKLEEFQRHVVQAKRIGQLGLHERLVLLRKRVLNEAALTGHGVNKFLDEDEVVRLMSECKDGLMLTLVRNFGRYIPEPVCEKKMKADEAKVFDNYVVLHFDPSRKSVTPPKDPILFGIFEGSHRLYFIADWIDDVCDFTLEKAEKLLGSAAHDIAGNLERP